MRKLFIGLTVLYLLCCILLYAIQNKVLFYPHTYDNSYRYKSGVEHEIPLTDDIEMNAVLLHDSPGARSNKVILYFHGNKGNVRRGIYQSRVMREKDCDIFVVDYRGYGKTEGQLVNDKQMLADADAAYQYLSKLYKEENIYVIGYSLGSGMASYVASKNQPSHLFLVAPFRSLTAMKDQWLWMFPDFLLKYRLDNHEHLKAVKCGVTIVHGTEDNVVPYSHSAYIKSSYPHVELITIDGESHRGVIFDSQLRNAIERVVRRS